MSTFYAFTTSVNADGRTWESLMPLSLLLVPRALLLVLRYRTAHADSFVTEPAKNQMIGRVPQDRF